MLGAAPGSFGATSRALLIALGLYLIYRRLSWWPMAAAALFGMLATLFLMPLALGVGDGSELRAPMAIAVISGRSRSPSSGRVFRKRAR